MDAIWTYSVRGLYVPMFSFVDPRAQFRWIFGHPGSFASMLGMELFRRDTYSLMIGVFGWMGPHLPQWTRAAYWAALGLAAVLDGGKPLPLRLHAKAVALGAYLFTFAVMATFVYLSWDGVGQPRIEGIQPRYFLPIIPVLLLLPRGGPKLVSGRFSQAVVPVIAMLVAVLASGCTWWTLVQRYYHLS